MEFSTRQAADTSYKLHNVVPINSTNVSKQWLRSWYTTSPTNHLRRLNNAWFGKHESRIKRCLTYLVEESLLASRLLLVENGILFAI